MRNLLKTGWVIVLLSVTIIASSQPVAKVISTSGTVSVTRGGKVRSLQRGANLSVGDVVQTQSGAVARLRYNNGSFVTLTNKANYQILKYAPQQEVEIEAGLNRGQARIVTEGSRRKKEILKTKVVAMAILGTDVTANTGSGTTLQVTLAQGLVNIDGVNLNPGVYTVSVGANDNVIITTPEGQEVTGQQEGASEIVQNADVEDIGQLVTTVVAAEGSTSALSDPPVATLSIICP